MPRGMRPRSPPLNAGRPSVPGHGALVGAVVGLLVGVAADDK